MPWGYHLLIDASNGNDNVSNEAAIRQFVADLVIKIDMVAYGDIWIAKFATHDPAKAGFSFCQMIETSNITGHFVDSNHDFYIDIFSCKPFGEFDVLDLIEYYFSPEHVRSAMIERDAIGI